MYLTDEGLVKYYHFVSQYDALFFDASGSFVSPLPWLKYEKGEKKRILLYALKARLPSGGSPPIAILEHITSEHNVFSIRQPLMRLKEIEQKIFGKRNGDMEREKKMTLAERLFMFVHVISYKWVDGKSRKI